MHFNSRPHGGRPIFSDNLAFTSSFQLTPSRRATINLPPLALRSLISTHALTEGDLCTEIRKAETISFQLTPSRRATARPFLIQLTNWLNFNSRPHGGRRIARSHIKSINIFQLTPSRRATHENHLPLRMVIFQLTPSRRATSMDIMHVGKFTFQLTPSRRATRDQRVSRTEGRFQLTPSRRATRKKAQR